MQDGPGMASGSDAVAPQATGSFTREPIAIVGMAARFPQEAASVEDLWTFLLQARQAMTEFPSDRINGYAHYHPDAEHGGTVRFWFSPSIKNSIYHVTNGKMTDWLDMICSFMSKGRIS